MELVLNMLGPLQLEIDGVDITPAAPKERMLLVLLAVEHPHVVGVDRLTDALWPHRPVDQARHVLQVRVAALRKLLRAADAPSIVEHAAPGYRLSVPAEAIDVHRYAELLARARRQLEAGDAAAAAASFRNALAMWRGEPFSDLQASTTLEGEASRLLESRLAAIEDLVDADLACGRHHALIPELEALVAANPLRERLSGQRILALYRCGRQAEALRACASIRRRLVNELGLEPGTALRELEAAVLHQRPELEWSPVAVALPPRPATMAMAGVHATGSAPWMLSDVRYARCRDGVNIAYQVAGDGPLDLIVVPGYISHLDTWWEARSGRLVRRLASFSRLIMFDKRGMGLSDRPAQVDVEDWVEDVRAVLDAVGSGRTAVLGVSAGCPVAILFAAGSPERVRSLVLYGGFARLLHEEDNPFGIRPEDLEAFIEGTERGWGSGIGLGLHCPSARDDPAVREQFGRHQRMSASPGAASAYLRALADIDVRQALPMVGAPTLVLHPARDRATPVELARCMAEQIPDAALVELDSADHLIWFSDAIDVITDEIQDFLTGAAPNREVSRVLATVVSIATPAGEPVAASQRGRRLADADQRAGRLVERFRGRVVRHPGDGVLATFDGPARAVRCASAIVADLGVGAGVHSGECERVGEDIGGVGVRIATRVASLASPGEVLVSQTVRDLVTGSAIRFGEDRSHALEDVPGSWRVYTVTST